MIARIAEVLAMSFATLFRRPSAFLPVAMSAAALVLVLVSVAVFGAVHEADEGAVAHLWQLLIAGQLPVVAYFGFKWLPSAPRAALPVLAAQAASLFAALSQVYFLHL